MELNEKRGKTLLAQILTLIIALVCVSILAVLFFRLFSTSGYDEVEATARGYSSMVESAFEEANELGRSEFSIFITPDKKDQYFLVYFSEKRGYINIVHSTYDSPISTGSGAASVYDETYVNELYTVQEYTTDFFLQRDSKHDICVCHLDDENIELSRDVHDLSDQEKLRAKKDPLSSEEVEYYSSLGVENVLKIKNRNIAECISCYNVGGEVDMNHVNDSTMVDNEKNILDLDELSAIHIQKKGNKYLLTVHSI